MIGVFVGLVWYGLIGRSRFAIVSATRRDRAPLRSMAGAEPLVWPHGTRGAPHRVALALMFILYAESYGSIRTFALKRDDAVQPNCDLLALGAANIVSGLFHGTPVGAGPALQQTRTRAASK